MGRLYFAAAALAAMVMFAPESAQSARSGDDAVTSVAHASATVVAQNNGRRRRARPRVLGPARGPGAGGQQWQAARAARNCAPGGQILSSEPVGNGFNFRILMGSRVVDVQVDRNGNCR